MSREETELERLLGKPKLTERDIDRIAYNNTEILVKCGVDPYHACIEMGYFVSIQP